MRIPAGVWCVALALTAAAASAPAQEKQPSPDEALKLLKEGNARFVAGKPKKKYINESRMIELALEQRPYAVILACADSRADPAIVFDKDLGELFQLRVAGNVTGSTIVGSIEYAVTVPQSPLIVVMGHSKCGAVDAALAGKELPSDNLRDLIRSIHPGPNLPKDKDEARNAAIRANVLFHAGALTAKSKIIKELVGSGRVKIAAGVYSIKTGAVDWLEVPGK